MNYINLAVIGSKAMINPFFRSTYTTVIDFTYVFSPESSARNRG